MKKRILFAVTAVLALTNAKAQQGDFWNKTSLELGYGYAMPFTPTTNIKTSDYNSFVNFTGGVNYDLNEVWGLRATYAFHKFEHKNTDNLGVDYHKFMLEGTFNILESLNNSASYYYYSNLELQVHAGIGGTFAKPTQGKGTNKMGNLQIGLKPSFKTSERVSLFLDVTYVSNFNQKLGYNGLSAHDTDNGSYLSANIGVQVKLGR